MDAKIVVDASVWISQLMPQDSNHNPSLVWFNQFNAAGGILVAPIFLQIEVAAAVSRLTGQAALSRNAVADLNSNPLILFAPMDAILVQAALDVASDLRLRAGDSIYVAVAHQLGIPLVSWDREQLDRASRLITTYTPLTYIF